MFPIAVSGNLTDSAAGYSVLFAHLFLSTAVFKLYEYLLYISAGKLSLVLSHASLLSGVLHVVHLRTKKEVIGIHARRIIALVANVRVFGNRPHMHFPRETVCKPSLSPGKCQLAVAIRHSCASKLPAPIGAFFNMAHQHFFGRPASVTAAAVPGAEEAVTFSQVVVGHFKLDRALVAFYAPSGNCSAGSIRKLNAHGFKNNRLNI